MNQSWTGMTGVAVFMILLLASTIVPVRQVEGAGEPFLLRILLVDRDMLDPVETFASLKFQAGPLVCGATNTKQRHVGVYLWGNVDYTITIEATAMDGRVAIDQRTVRYVIDEDPDRDRFYDLVMVLDYKRPEGERSGHDVLPSGDLQEPPSGENGQSGAGNEADNPWRQSVEEAADDDTPIKGLKEMEEEIVIPRSIMDEIERRAEHDILEGERRIVLSGFELTAGDPDVWSSPAIIDPEHLVVAVQYPNGESRVLDGEAAVRAMRERGFLEEGSFELTSLGRKGWEEPYVSVEEEEEEVFSVSINLSASSLKPGESVTLSPSIEGGESPFNFNWYADGKGYFSTSKVVSLSWDAPGKKEVSLHVTDDYFQETMASVTVTVEEKEQDASTGESLRFVEELTVSSNGKQVTTSMPLQDGKMYVIEASGLITHKAYSESGKHLTTQVHDPAYTVSFVVHHPEPRRIDLTSDHSLSAFSTELRLDDDASLTTHYIRGKHRLKPLFKKYNPEHVYRVEFEGSGHRIPFYYYWSNDAYSRNTGSFTVRIYEFTK